MMWRCPKCGFTIGADVTPPVGCKCGFLDSDGAGRVESVPRRRGQTHRAKPPARTQCSHRGDELRQEACPTCRGNVQIKVFACSVHGECTLGKALPGLTCCATCSDYHSPPRFVTSADLAADTLKLVPRLPPDLAGIVGIPRSGMIPAALLSTVLHLPLFEMTGEGPRQLHCGYRLADVAHVERSGPLLLVDDTSMHGNAMRIAKERWAKYCPGKPVIAAVVYCSPPEFHVHGPMPDLWAVDLEHPHLLEWCLFNCGFMQSAALDFDGIMTIDNTPLPQYLPRRHRLRLIVTGRLECERQRTEDWLRTHGIGCERIVFFPGTLQQREKPGAIAAHKANHFAESGLKYFVESCPEQAQQIARLVPGRVVICPAAKRCFT